MIVFDQRIPIKYSLHKKKNSRLYLKQKWANNVYKSSKDVYGKLGKIKLDLVEMKSTYAMENLDFYRISLMGRENGDN